MSSMFVFSTVVPWLVFAVSASSKISSAGAQRAFAASLRPLGFVPDRLVAPVAVLVTGAEVAVALGLGWVLVAAVTGAPGGRPVAFAALAAAGALLTVLAGGVALALRRGAKAACACFGAEVRPLRPLHVVRNVVLIAHVVACLVLVAVDRHHAVWPGEALLGAAAGAVVALVLIRLDDLVDLFVRRPVSGGSRS